MKVIKSLVLSVALLGTMSTFSMSKIASKATHAPQRWLSTTAVGGTFLAATGIGLLRSYLKYKSSEKEFDVRNSLACGVHNNYLDSKCADFARTNNTTPQALTSEQRTHVTNNLRIRDTMDDYLQNRKKESQNCYDKLSESSDKHAKAAVIGGLCSALLGGISDIPGGALVIPLAYLSLLKAHQLYTQLNMSRQSNKTLQKLAKKAETTMAQDICHNDPLDTEGKSRDLYRPYDYKSYRK